MIRVYITAHKQYACKKKSRFTYDTQGHEMSGYIIKKSSARYCTLNSSSSKIQYKIS